MTFVVDPALDPWLGCWRLELSERAPQHGWYESGLHHAVVFDWLALGEVGEELFRARFGTKIFGGMLDGKGKAVTTADGKRSAATGIIPIALVGREPVATPFDHVANPAILFVSAAKPLDSRVLLVQHDALTPLAFVVADTLADLGLTRGKRSAAASEQAKDRGNASFQAGDLDGAAEHYREAIRLDWTNFRAINNLARASVEADDAASAAGLFRVAIRTAPGQLLPILSLITQLRNVEQDDEARWWVGRAKQIGTTTPDEAALLETLATFD